MPTGARGRRGNGVLWAAIVCFSLFVLAVYPPAAQASIRLSNLVFDVETPAGSSQTLILDVTNLDDTAQNLVMTYYDWDVDERGNHAFLPGGSVERSLSDLITFAPSVLRLESSETQQVRITVDSPSDGEGTYWGMLMVEREIRPDDPDAEGLGIQIHTRFGIKIYNTVEGTAEPEGRIAKLTVQRGEGSPPVPTLEFWNTGKVKVAPHGWFELRNARGEAVWRSEFDGQVVLPGRRFVVEQPYSGPALPAGRYVVLGVVDHGGARLIGGQVVMDIQ